MCKRIVAVILALVLSFGSIPGARALEVEAPSAILVDLATGTVLYEKNSHARLSPASVTKVMTLLLVMEALADGRISWDDTVTASENAASKGGSQVYLEVGECMSMDEMIKSVVVSSANDCATALAEHVAGSEESFVQMMNERAEALGCADTDFVNCTGLDAEGHLTSAHDLALISRALLKHEKIRDYTTIWMDTVRDGKFGLSNTNKLVRFYDGTTGLKTGYTSTAGHCLAASAKRDGIELIAVVLNCKSSSERFESAKALLNYGFANYALVSAKADEALPSVRVKLGAQSELTPVLQEVSPILIEKGELSRVKKTVDLCSEITAPVKAGQQLGTLRIETDARELAQIPILAPGDIEKLTTWQMTVRLLRKLCMAA